METLIQDLRIAVRSIARRPVFALVAVATLALAMGATTALFSVVEGVLLRPLPYPDSARIVSVWQTARDNPQPNAGGSVSHVNFLDWQRAASSFESAALYTGASYIVTGGSDTSVVPGADVTSDFFKVFGVALVRGRTFTPAEMSAHGPRVVVVSEGFWRDRLGARPDVIGSTVEISSRPWEVVGVAPAGFAFPRNAELWTPVQNDDQACGRDCVFLNGIARLKPGVSVGAARQELRAVAQRLESAYPAANRNTTIALTTLQDEIVGDVRPALVMLLGAVFMVLLIACANVANLLLVRGATRQTEIAMRIALGAGRLRLLRLLLSEGLVLAAAGAVGGVLLAAWGIDLLKRLAPAGMPRLGDVRFDALTFVFALAVGATTVVLFALGPALHAMATPPTSLIGGRGEASSGRARWSRSGLLVAEVALSLMLLLGAGVLVRSLVRLQAIEPGFDPDGLTIFTVALLPAGYPQPADVVRGFDRITDRLRATPGVQSVAAVNGLPLGPSENVFNFARTDRPAPEPGTAPIALYRVVDPPYFATMGIPIVAGRAFTAADRDGAQPAVIINRRMADRFWPGEDPIGQLIRVSNSEQPRQIVGVAADVRSQSLTELPNPEMYVPEAQAANRALTLVVRSGLPAGQILTAAREAVRQIDPKLPLIRPGTERALVDAELARPRFNLLLLGLFAGVAIALAAVGIYGVVAYAVAQRRREIGVRIALGASGSEVVRMVLRDGMKPVAAGLVLGTAGALAIGRVMAGLLYQVEPNDPATLAAAAVVLLAVSVFACFVPARRAARIAPADALRGD
jgi:putative ABC transport system permease protein